jgi:outer membrane protein insertion porin family
MLNLGLTSRARILCRVSAAVAVLALGAGRAHATGEAITDVRVLDNQRTEEATVRSIAGVRIGETLEADTLDKVRERLNTAGLFSDINVWWEPHGAGVRVNIAVKDKFPWAPVPTGTWSANNKALGILFVHGNLFGRGKQFLLGARLATVDSGAVLAYRDPAMFGSWIYWQMQGVVQRQVIPEFQNYGMNPVTSEPIQLANPYELRETTLVSYGIEPTIGIAWFRRVKTQVSWHLESFNFKGSTIPSSDTTTPVQSTVPSTNSGVVGIGRAVLTFDFRAREFAVMTGAALAGQFDYATPGLGSDFTYWRAAASWEHGIRFFKSHNLIYWAFAAHGHDLPFWAEATAGGTNLRGYLFQQFRGDTQLAGKVEYHFPLFSIGSLDFRALGFYDLSAVWFQSLPTQPIVTGPPDAIYLQRQTADLRTFPQAYKQGFSLNESVHNAVGGGLRFFLRSVAVPLIGFDAGYGLEAKDWRFFLIVGA